MTALDDILALRFAETGRELLVLDLNEEWASEFPESVMVTFGPYTWLLVVSAETDPLLLEIECRAYAEGQLVDNEVLVLRRLPPDNNTT